MIILGFKLETRGLPRELRQSLGASVKTTLRQVAEYWYRTMFPDHFVSSNRAKYSHEKRNDKYLRVLKPMFGDGPGRYVDELLSGKSRRFMASATISGTSRRATVLMKPPAYFTNPFVGSFTDPKTRKTRRISRQPDKVREATQTTAEELAELRTFAGRRMKRLLEQAGVRNITIVRPR